MKRLLVILLVLVLTTLPALGEETVPQLSVHGQALLEVPADQARLNLAVVSTAATAEEALSRNNEAMKKVAAALTKVGLKTREYRTGRFEIRPEWSPRPINAAPNWRPEIQGYTVRNSLQITTLNLKKVGTFIEAATEAGANSVDSLIFDLAEPAAFRNQAITQATANAQRDARELAQAAGVTLEKVLSITLAPAGFPSQRLVATFAKKAASVLITPGTVSVRADVTMVYRIGQR